MGKPVVAIVGKPNVGKSMLFNRIMSQRIVITDDVPGSTRDRIYGETQWLGKSFVLIDTGGLTLESSTFKELITLQTDIAINEADLIIFIVSAKELMTSDDQYIAQKLYQAKKKVILVINKSDHSSDADNLYEYMALGFGEPIAISGMHGLGINLLLDAVVNNTPGDVTSDKTSNDSKLVIIGRPNVGKSSLINTLVSDNRSVVSHIAGTTTDPVHSYIKHNGQQYSIVDTAGIKRPKQVKFAREKYSVLRAQIAVKTADIIILVIDITQEISNQDAIIAGLAFDAQKPVLLVANKWDLIADHSQTNQTSYQKKLINHFKFLKPKQVLFISATAKINLRKIWDSIDKIQSQLKISIKNRVLNQILTNAQLVNPPALCREGVLRIYYGVQIRSAVPTFVLFVNNPRFLHFSYKRFLINQIRISFGFDLVPVRIILRSK